MMELALLRAFINAPQRTLTSEHLAQATSIHGIPVTRSFDGIIRRLRRKLPGIIQTRRSEGYVFSVPVESV